ncbi:MULTISPECIES: amidase [unclassified Bradyrhizobium]|uniref:amidase n=1 Tax=unclassified Bradyrhizobium TaxID=2631580 RepID=UPI001BA860DB|nr:MULTISPECIES: amidase [unclassified Bradyrhizobium]MBR1224404.1 amidase [Bradyrhizobium sp. AUGA SZCCT0176]MBR1283192.1 amidase [Bradyrhizobium sp. AUGA SZCCT0177]MBR1297907.1 amidase [Bradyrhizobium sp. AUGA SZCCT0042]
MSDDMNWLSAREMTRRFAKGDLSPVDVLEATLARLHAVNPALNATCLLDEPQGRRLAAESAERWRRGEPMGPLDGVPVAIKDTGHVKGWPMRIGSHSTATAPSAEDTPGVARLREAGAVFFCKTTTPEFGWKGITHGPLTGITRNPWDTSRTPGGSSGGSAALVAAGVVPLATGGDGGGSIRIPAAFSGVFGLKPSYGVVPNLLGPMGTLAVYGGLSRDVADSALLLNVLTRPDARDSFAIPYRGIDYLDGLDQGVAGMKIAWSPDLGFPVTEPAVVAGMQPAIDALVKAGADVKSIDLDLSAAQPALEVIWGASHAAVVRDFDGAQLAALDPGLLRLVIAAQDISASELQAAYADMRTLSQQMHHFHQHYDLLLTPTIPITAFAAGIDTPDSARFPQWFDWTPLTWPFNLTRQPAASVPCGFVEGLPIGLQIVGPMFSEEKILRASRCVEQACASGARPNLTGQPNVKV